MNMLFNTRDNEEFKGVKTDNSMTIINKLRQALAEELIAWYQYYTVKETVFGQEAKNISDSLEEFGEDELKDHSYKLRYRLVQLGDNLSFLSHNWNEFTPNKFRYPESLNVLDVLRLMISSEEAAIKTYNDLIDLAEACHDKVTEKIAKEILVDEEDHLQQLRDYLDDIING